MNNPKMSLGSSALYNVTATHPTLNKKRCDNNRGREKSMNIRTCISDSIHEREQISLCLCLNSIKSALKNDYKGLAGP